MTRDRSGQQRRTSEKPKFRVVGTSEHFELERFLTLRPLKAFKKNVRSIMYYDLNVPYISDKDQLQKTLAFLEEREFSLGLVNNHDKLIIHLVGYNVVALNHIISGKLPAELVGPFSPRGYDLLIEFLRNAVFLIPCHFVRRQNSAFSDAALSSFPTPLKIIV